MSLNANLKNNLFAAGAFCVIVAIAVTLAVKRSGGDSADTDVRQTVYTVGGERTGGDRPTKPASATAGTRRTKGKVSSMAVSPDGDEPVSLPEDSALAKEREAVVKELLSMLAEESDDVVKGEKFSASLRRLMSLGDKKGVRMIADRLRRSASASARREALEAYTWLGAEGLDGITSMLGDADANLAQDAFQAWQDSFSEIQDSAYQMEVLLAAARTFDDPDILNALMLEAAQIDQPTAIEVYDAIITDASTTGAAKDVAAEVYNHITDGKYTGSEAALALAEQLRKDMTEHNPEFAQWLENRKNRQPNGGAGAVVPDAPPPSP